ncbi:MAG: flavin reductase family protein [Actinobacteria bacterium]|nr:flavin reductase family protein [Actinomycetota bacterium]
MAEEAFTEACVEVMARTASAVAILTLEDGDGEKHGMTITSLSSVSSEPPSVVVCVGEGASSHRWLVPGARFGVSLLGAGQVPYSLGFSWAKSDDPFADFPWERAEDGTPWLSEAAAHMICEVEQVTPYHGSAVVMARVVGCGVHKDETLVYWRRKYFDGLTEAEGGVTGTW